MGKRGKTAIPLAPQLRRPDAHRRGVDHRGSLFALRRSARVRGARAPQREVRVLHRQDARRRRGVDCARPQRQGLCLDAKNGKFSNAHVENQ